MGARNRTTAGQSLAQAEQSQREFREFRMKRAMIWKRHRPEEILAKLREADDALSRRVVHGNVAREYVACLSCCGIAVYEGFREVQSRYLI